VRILAGKNTVEIILSASDRASGAIRGAFGSIEASSNRAMGTVKAAAGIASGALAALTGYVAKVGIDYNAMQESSQVAWNTLLGSQDKAKKMLQDISNFAKSTQFDTTSVDMMAKYMHNAGFEGKALFDQLTKVADISGAFNITADAAQEMTRQMSQVQQAGVAYTEDLNILQDKGVPIYKAIAEQLGINVAGVKKMASEGKITSEIYNKAFDSIANKVKGSSEAQSKTFDGMISTLKDNLNMIAGELSKPLFGLMKKGLEEVQPILDKFLGGLKNGGIAGGLAAIFPPSVSNAIKNISDEVKGLFKSNEFKEFLSGLGEAVTFYKNYLVMEFDTLKGFLIGAWKAIKDLFSGDGNLGESLGRIFKTIKDIAAPILEDAVKYIGEIIGKLKKFWDENGTQIIDAVQNIFSFIAAVFEFYGPYIADTFSRIWSGIKVVLSGALDIILGLIKVFSGLFTGDWSKMWEGLQQLAHGQIEILKGLIKASFLGQIIDWIKSAANSIGNWFSKMWTDGKNAFSNLLNDTVSIFNRIKSALTDPINSAKTIIKNAIDSIKGFFGSIATKIKMPHFSIEWNSVSAFGKTIKYPTGFDVDWYDKGGVFYGPQVIGVGENRPEFVGALDDLRKIVREESGGKGDTNVYVYGNNVDIDENRLVRILQRAEVLYG
jgi:tape measure domain-containing protein